MAERKTRNDRKHNQKDIMEAISTLAAAVQQQQEQINSILNVLGGGDTHDEEVNIGFGSAVGIGGGESAEGQGGLKYPYGFDRDEAKTKLVDLWFNTPMDKLPELTETPRMAVTPTAYVEAMNEYIENLKNDKYESLDSIYIRRKDKRMKSVSRKSGMEAIAFSQIQEEKKELGEEQKGYF